MSEKEMYSHFFDIYPELKGKCCGFRVFHWSDRLKKILINVKESEIKILFSIRKDEIEDAGDQFSALLIPAGYTEVK